MQCRELIEILEKLAPREYACDWDNPGFLAGREGKEVRRVLVALDATDQVIAQAVEEGADMVVTHHPLIFRPLKQVNDRNFISRRIVTLIQKDICYYAMHTNFDIAPGCMGDLAAKRLGMIPEGPLEVTGEAEGCPIGIGRIGAMPEAMTLDDLARRVKEAFGLPFVVVYGSGQVPEPVSRVAISPGSGGSMMGCAVAAKAQALVTGDVGHHDGIDAAANHMAVIDGGHYGIERIFLPFVAGYLRREAGEELTVVEARTAFPARVL